MIFESQRELKTRIGIVIKRDVSGIVEVFEDTSEFMDITQGCVIRIAENDYLVMGHAREGRFGIDDQPKFWVKTTVDLTTFERKIIKLVFQETFESRVGETVYQCKRNAEKEAEVLLKMRGNDHFMQGLPVEDTAGNVVRVIDYVTGPSLYDYLRRLKMPHKEYYLTEFSKVMRKFIDCVEALAELHHFDLHHGDIRADHLIVNQVTGKFVWIDFDYEINAANYDVICLGNVLQQVVGKGRHSIEDIRYKPMDYPDMTVPLELEDMSKMFRHRVANLSKLFPYISSEINELLMRYSAGSSNSYTDIHELLHDLIYIYEEEMV